MSRLIVKNVPAYLNEERLKEHFSTQGGVVTDTKILRRHDGTSRRFGFVGFKREEEAQEALKYFNRTFIDTCKIDVGIAKAITDEPQIRKKEHSQDASDGQQKSAKVAPQTTSSDVSKKNSKNAKGVSFDQFMAIMAPKKKRKTWQNEEGQDGEGTLDSMDFQVEDEKKSRKVKRSKNNDEANDDAEVVTGRLGESLQADAEDLSNEPVQDEGMTDLDYMYKRMKRKVGEDLEVDDQKFEQSDSEKEEDDDKKSEVSEDSVDPIMVRKQQEEKRQLEEKAGQDEANVDTIMTSGRLFIRNLPFEATEEDLESYFAKYGAVSQAHITLDKSSKKSKGIAFVTFADPLHALAAFRAADGSTFQGRLLHVMPAVKLREDTKEPVNVRDKRRQELKAGAAKDFNWSTLFMSSDAVASSIAERLGVTKSDLLNPDDDAKGGKVSPAVRLALAETNVIQETKDYLEKEGINVEAFQGSNVKRSDTVMLVKNIPFGTTRETLQGLFEKYGKVERVLMPPSGTIAIVEMEVAGESKVAFKALAYKRIGNSVLYLEKAPIGVIIGPSQNTRTADRTDDKSEAIAAEEDAADASATLFVKNLSFSTTDERLAMAFSSYSDFVFARIQRRPSKNGAVKLSMGYGFVGFRDADAAKRAQRGLDKSTLDGHVLAVSFAKRGHDEDDVTAVSNSTEGGSAPTTKLIIKNLPFQASKRDVRDLFAAHGKLKSVRVPRKSAGGINSSGGSATGVRGFGFVEFVNRKEAENAYNSLKHTHLLGRHLVLEWDLQGAGSQADQLESLRTKTARGLRDVGIRKEKLHLNEEDIRAASAKDKKDKEEDEEESEEED